MSYHKMKASPLGTSCGTRNSATTYPGHSMALKSNRTGKKSGLLNASVASHRFPWELSLYIINFALVKQGMRFTLHLLLDREIAALLARTYKSLADNYPRLLI